MFDQSMTDRRPVTLISKPHGPKRSQPDTSNNYYRPMVYSSASRRTATSLNRLANPGHSLDTLSEAEDENRSSTGYTKYVPSAFSQQHISLKTDSGHHSTPKIMQTPGTWKVPSTRLNAPPRTTPRVLNFQPEHHKSTPNLNYTHRVYSQPTPINRIPANEPMFTPYQDDDETAFDSIESDGDSSTEDGCSTVTSITEVPSTIFSATHRPMSQSVANLANPNFSKSTVVAHQRPPGWTRGSYYLTNDNKSSTKKLTGCLIYEVPTKYASTSNLSGGSRQYNPERLQENPNLIRRPILTSTPTKQHREQSWSLPGVYTVEKRTDSNDWLGSSSAFVQRPNLFANRPSHDGRLSYYNSRRSESQLSTRSTTTQQQPVTTSSTSPTDSNTSTTLQSGPKFYQLDFNIARASNDEIDQGAGRNNLHPDSYASARPNYRKGYDGNYQRYNPAFRERSNVVENSGRSGLYSSYTNLYIPEASSTSDSQPYRTTDQNTYHAYNGSTHDQSTPSQLQPHTRQWSSVVVHATNPASSLNPTSTPNTRSPRPPPSPIPPSEHVYPNNKTSTPRTPSPLPGRLTRPIQLDWCTLLEQSKLDRQLARLAAKRLRLGQLDQSEGCLVLLTLLMLTDSSDGSGIDGRIREALKLKSRDQARKTNGETITNSALSSQDEASDYADDDVSVDEEDELNSSLMSQTSNGNDKHTNNMTAASAVDGDFNNSAEQRSFRILRNISTGLSRRVTRKQKLLTQVSQRLDKATESKAPLRTQMSRFFDSNSTTTASILTNGTAKQNFATDTSNPGDQGRSTISRFDRWHKTALDMTQLLCQLSRRLAMTDAKISCSSWLHHSRTAAAADDPKHEDGDDGATATNPHRNLSYSDALNTIRRQDPPPTPLWSSQVSVLDTSMSTWLHQKESLLAQIREAQSFQTEFENTRIRILDAVPSHFPSEAINGETVPLGDSYNPTISLRERLAAHFSTFLQAVTDLQVLETCLRIDQEILQNICYELRFDPACA